MAKAVKVGTKVPEGRYSGTAFKKGITTADYQDNFYDLGFRPKAIMIESVSGAGIIEVCFKHAPELQDLNYDASVSGVDSEVASGDSKLYRDRDHQVIAVRSSTPTQFRIEAW